MNLGKIAFDPGHYANANVGPGAYREGNAMLDFALAISKKYDCFLTRTTDKNLDLKQRALIANGAGCQTLISLHTNAPEAAKGIVIFYSITRPQDKVVAEALGKELAKVTGIAFREAKTRTFTDGVTDYYGIIRDGIRAGLKSVFLIEHGSHWEFAADMEKKIAACVDVYGKFLELPNKEMTLDEALTIIAEFAGTNPAYWAARKDIDKWFPKYNIDIAKAIKEKKL